MTKQPDPNDETAIEAKIDDLPVSVALTSIELTKDEEKHVGGLLGNIADIEQVKVDKQSEKEKWRQWTVQ